jgi:hypothetical protein
VPRRAHQELGLEQISASDESRHVDKVLNEPSGRDSPPRRRLFLWTAIKTRGANPRLTEINAKLEARREIA